MPATTCYLRVPTWSHLWRTGWSSTTKGVSVTMCWCIAFLLSFLRWTCACAQPKPGLQTPTRFLQIHERRKVCCVMLRWDKLQLCCHGSSTWTNYQQTRKESRRHYLLRSIKGGSEKMAHHKACHQWVLRCNDRDLQWSNLHWQGWEANRTDDAVCIRQEEPIWFGESSWWANQ